MSHTVNRYNFNSSSRRVRK